MPTLKNIGRYFLLLSKVFKKPEKSRIYTKMILRDINDLGSSSLGIVVFISIFMGAVVAIQMYNNIKGSALPIPNDYIGHATKMILILEFSPTMISIILAGKVGSFIASSIGTMRTTEQIDALEVMGVNSASFLILPKIIACVLFNPLLILISLSLGLFGGWISGEVTGNWSSAEYIIGIQMQNTLFFYWYCIVKTIVFSFIIATIPAYFGYFVKGGSLEVGKASTQAVVWTCILIIVLDLLITQIMLS
ncbi:MAG: MlaE family ABC transporter permease [Flavobacteriales bacterium AspAUS03]